MTQPRSAPTIREDHLSHRADFVAFVLAKAEPWHRIHLSRLYKAWEVFNEAYFEGAMHPPYILLAEPSVPRRYGDCGRVSGFGGRSQIRLRPSLLTGTHPHMKPDSQYAPGRHRFVEDILLHEMIHQYHQEITGIDESSYHGHGPVFRDACNRIGASIGLPLVRTCKQRGADKDLPSCSYWPHIIRPVDYYGGAYRIPSESPQPIRETFELPADPDLLGASLARLLSDTELATMRQALERELAQAGRSYRVTSSGDTTDYEKGIDHAA
jgi:hypothetical protein